MQKKTVNQLLEFLYENYSTQEIHSNSKLINIKNKLLEIKISAINGGNIVVKNSKEILSKLIQMA